MKIPKNKELLYAVGAALGIWITYETFTGLQAAGSALLQKLGLKQDPATLAAANKIAQATNTANASGANSYWSPLYWRVRSPNTKLIYDPSIAAFMYSIASKIYDGIGYVYDDPVVIIAAFKLLNSKLSVSVVSSDFQYKYQKDLLQFLIDKLDTEHQVQFLAGIIQYCDNLPDIVSGQ